MSFLFCAILLIFTIVFHTSAAEYFSDWLGARPDAMLLTTVFLGLRRDRAAALVGGFVLGLAQDALSGSLLGLNALLKGLIGYCAGGLKSTMTSRRLFFYCSTAFFASVFNLALSAGLAMVFLPDKALPVEFWLEGARTAGLNAVLAPMIIGLLGKIEVKTLPSSEGAPYLERP